MSIALCSRFSSKKKLTLPADLIGIVRNANFAWFWTSRFRFGDDYKKKRRPFNGIWSWSAANDDKAGSQSRKNATITPLNECRRHIDIRTRIISVLSFFNLYKTQTLSSQPELCDFTMAESIGEVLTHNSHWILTPLVVSLRLSLHSTQPFPCFRNESSKLIPRASLTAKEYVEWKNGFFIPTVSVDW